MNQKILIIIPAFNEEGAIRQVIRTCFDLNLGLDILVINDGSTDKTEEEVLQTNARLVSLPYNAGLGVALQTGYKYAIRHGYDWIIQLDGDGQHNPKHLLSFFDAINNGKSDIIIGSRFTGEGEYRGGRIRRWGIALFSRFVSFLVREKITDVLSGFIALNRDVLTYCTTDHYEFDVPDADFLLTLHRKGFKFGEIPIKVEPRTAGSSMHSGLGPFYYVLKMFFSIFVVLLRKRGD